MGRDFTGSVRYGTFTYSGTCPTTTPGPLPGIKIKMASATGGPCFTDLSTATTTDPAIGYICEPGSPSTIHFGFPGNEGFIIGGANFVAKGANENGYAWGSIGLPTYDLTISSCTASCGASCSAQYCNPSCTAVCTGKPSCVATDSSATCTNNAVETTSGGTTFFAPSGFTPTNCGLGAGQCCTKFAFPDPVGYRFWRLQAVALRGGSIDFPDGNIVNWQLSEFNMLDGDGNRVASNTQFALQNDGTWPNGGSPTGETIININDGNIDTKFLAYDGGAGKSVVLDFGSAKAFTSYRWITANDATWRDMVSWVLYGSNDNNNWTPLDTKTGQSVTTSRKTIVGPFSFTLP